MGEFETDYKAMRDALKRETGGEYGKDAMFWTVVEGVADILDGTVGTKLSAPVAGAQFLYNKFQEKRTRKDPSAVPNPWFVWNGHDDVPGPYVQNYLKHRTYKGIAAKAIGAAGTAAQEVTFVDVGNLAVHGNALGSTAAHLFYFKKIADSYKQTKTISNWLGVIIKMKAIKAGIRTAGVVGAAIPVPMVGTVSGVLATAAAMGAKLTMTKVCLATAADLHWRAFQERTLVGALGGGQGQGPAMRIMTELFRRRGATRVFGQYDLDKIIREPNGWLAVQDKLMLF